MKKTKKYAKYCTILHCKSKSDATLKNLVVKKNVNFRKNFKKFTIHKIMARPLFSTQ